MEAIRTLAENIAAAHECDADVTIAQGFPPTVNDARAVALAEAVATSLPDGEYHAFARADHGRRGLLLRAGEGARDDGFPRRRRERRRLAQCCAIHSSRMMVDESVLPRGAAFLAGCATRFLERAWD